jgi:O-antigen/teichoic acid export membrane protein
VAWNLGAQAWSALLQLALVPFYLRVLGIEAYGLLAFYLGLQALSVVLDLGLSTTVNRELARGGGGNDDAARARDLVRTLEAWYWTLGLLLGLAVTAAAPWLAARWIQAGNLPPALVERALRLMGALFALQWPASLYQGGLLGLQRHARLNALRVTGATVTAAGAVAVLTWVSATIVALLAWQILAGALLITAYALGLWRALPRGNGRARVRARLGRELLPFSAGMTGILLTGAALSNLDKVVLSRLLPLDRFGYYALAAMVGNGLYVVINPTFNALFPRLSALCARGEADALRRDYHAGAQIMALLTVPLAATLCSFAFDAVRVWTRSAETARQAAPLVELLVAGTALNGLLHVPFALQLAHGWTSLSLRVNLGLTALMVPALLLATPRYGARGAAGVWLALNVAFLLLHVPLTHRRLLPGASRDWLLRDLAPVAGASVLVVGLARRLPIAAEGGPWAAAALAAVFVCALGAAALAAPLSRGWIRGLLAR